jgi:hypothetical protein
MDKDVRDARIEELERQLRSVLDRQEIYDCLMRYCRGIDRGDLALARSAYHPDALDDHGIYCGNSWEFVETAIAAIQQDKIRTQHAVSNITYDIDGDTANCEVSWFYASLNKPPLATCCIFGGRYLDRFERRKGKWAIAHRICLIDWYGTPGEQQPDAEIESFNDTLFPTSNMNDPSYKKPYTVSPDRIGFRWTPPKK